MIRPILTAITALLLTSCADMKFVEPTTGPSATLTLVQPGKTDAFRYDNSTRERYMLLSVKESTKTIRIPAGTSFTLHYGWDTGLAIVGGMNSFTGCGPTLTFIPEPNAAYTATPQVGHGCSLIILDSHGVAPEFQR